ncbi:YhbY family RNA-binding protein [Moraxella lincolnii]|uniref:Ribosome assembly protein YhbY n=1 Tax=Lwoffella lincolnii TaxID=90241 RepID=A0A1T0CEW8_9GAMM|nr:YhbY family RNA-binding protein [Moraxella lincolnii]OOS20671.1 ribosome assembly protein YhbY [Moraxella lincolnii]
MSNINTQKLDNDTLKRLRGIGHKLKPIVSIGGQGLSPSVLGELERALTDHELVKVRLPAGSKEERDALSAQLAKDSQALLIHHVGRMALLLRHNPQANPKLSNLVRFGG